MSKTHGLVLCENYFLDSHGNSYSEMTDMTDKHNTDICLKKVKTITTSFTEVCGVRTLAHCDSIYSYMCWPKQK